MGVTTKKMLLIAVALLLAFVLLAWLRGVLLRPDTAHMFVGAGAANLDIGPATGSRFPGLQAYHGDRPVTLLEGFAGPNGTVLVALRSLDWGTYCQRQMLQLQQYQPYFQAAGIGLAVISYDSPAAQRPFIKRHGITVPVLSDRDALSFRTLGILNENDRPGAAGYGLPHPGMIVVDKNGTVAGKLFVSDHTQRVDAAEALAFALRVLDLKVRARTR